jgi:hypothetical protein
MPATRAVELVQIALEHTLLQLRIQRDVHTLPHGAGLLKAAFGTGNGLFDAGTHLREG